MPPAGIGPSGTVDEGRRAKLPQANIAVANRTSHGTIRAKAAAGVASSRRPPTAPPIRLITNRALNESRCAPLTRARPASPVVTWPGNSATVEVIFAARASSPARMSAGRVMNDPPPASAFCAPAQSPARRSRSIAGQCAMDEQGKRPGAGPGLEGGLLNVRVFSTPRVPGIYPLVDPSDVFLVRSKFEFGHFGRVWG